LGAVDEQSGIEDAADGIQFGCVINRESAGVVKWDHLGCLGD
jgi:hypothetical protein